ncbi:PQQ-binding-like beta-propeller repeat protein [Streptomyces sp. NPDC001380]|uniref:outer membrane protein assembly factor BamB family protein n=1 Tax=Streptomyces sp. NPDC001380 TaxID=3364566 RepID=UPI00367851B9
MTTGPSPGQDAPEEDTGWAFRPRRPAGAEPRPYPGPPEGRPPHEEGPRPPVPPPGDAPRRGAAPPGGAASRNGDDAPRRTEGGPRRPEEDAARGGVLRESPARRQDAAPHREDAALHREDPARRQEAPRRQDAAPHREDPAAQAEDARRYRTAGPVPGRPGESVPGPRPPRTPGDAEPWQPSPSPAYPSPHPAAPAAVLDAPPFEETFAEAFDEPFPESVADPQPQPRGRRGRAGVIALVLAVLAAAGGAAAVLLHREEAAPTASKRLTRAWQVPAPAPGDELVGSWLTGRLLVRASTRGGLRAYDLAGGREVWHAAPRLDPAKWGTVPCAMSPAPTAQGLGTVAFGKDGDSCTWLAGVDAATGRIRWSVPLVDAGHPTAMPAGTFLQGGVATVVNKNFLGGLDVRTGRRVWGFRARGHYCGVHPWGASGIVLVDDYCADTKDRFTLTAYDGRTGRVLWTGAQDSQADLAHVFSGAPLIASVHTAAEDSVRVFSPSGRSRKLAVGDTEVLPGNDTAADRSARLVGDVLVAPAQSAQGGEIVGFDTVTGAKLWTHRSAVLATAAAGDDRVHAVSTSGTRQLLALDPGTGRATPVAALPAATGGPVLTAGTVYVTPDGTVLELDAQARGGAVRAYR